MATQNEVVSADSHSVPSWRNRIIALLLAAVVLIASYFVLAAFIPRWWGQRIADLAHGSFAKGIGWGLTFGTLCTALALVLLLIAPLAWRRRYGRYIAAVSVVAAVVTAIPNLMTLTIVLGDGNGAHAGQRILDVDAPGFRGATLVGAIVAAIVVFGAGLLVTRWRRRRRTEHPQLSN
ncbi:permease [Nocardia sp. NPDC049707]|uniref:permease n=1 Tax=Nocardia sp. NPDC049707 TaxID=3154735 RepID=UPI0034201E06